MVSNTKPFIIQKLITRGLKARDLQQLAQQRAEGQELIQILRERGLFGRYENLSVDEARELQQILEGKRASGFATETFVGVPTQTVVLSESQRLQQQGVPASFERPSVISRIRERIGRSQTFTPISPQQLQRVQTRTKAGKVREVAEQFSVETMRGVEFAVDPFGVREKIFPGTPGLTEFALSPKEATVSETIARASLVSEGEGSIEKREEKEFTAEFLRGIASIPAIPGSLFALGARTVEVGPLQAGKEVVAGFVERPVFSLAPLTVPIRGFKGKGGKITRTGGVSQFLEQAGEGGVFRRVSKTALIVEKQAPSLLGRLRKKTTLEPIGIETKIITKLEDGKPSGFLSQSKVMTAKTTKSRPLELELSLVEQKGIIETAESFPELPEGLKTKFQQQPFTAEVIKEGKVAGEAVTGKTRQLKLKEKTFELEGGTVEESLSLTGEKLFAGEKPIFDLKGFEKELVFTKSPAPEVFKKGTKVKGLDVKIPKKVSQQFSLIQKQAEAAALKKVTEPTKTKIGVPGGVAGLRTKQQVRTKLSQQFKLQERTRQQQRQFLVQLPKTKLESKQLGRTAITSRLKFKQKGRQLLQQKATQAIGQKQGQKQKQRTGLRIPTAPIAEFPRPAPKSGLTPMPFVFPILQFGKEAKKAKKRKKAKQPTFYTPSFAGAFLGIKEKSKQKIFTGLELRGIRSKRRKKR